MHELAICQALVSQLEDIAGQQTAWVRKVRVGIGPLSGIEPRLLESAYPLACAGTRAECSLKQRCNTIEEIHRGISY